MKWKIVTVWFSAALLAVLLPAGAIAAKNPARAQIKEDVKSGKLSKQEAKQMKVERKAFRAQVKAAKASGTISPEDKARLKAERKRLKDQINK